MERNRIPALWWYGAALICAFLVFATVYPVRIFNFRTEYFTFTGQLLSLRNEENFASLWSGMLLCIIAMHAFDGWALYRKSALPLARSWLMISIILVTLSFDEISSMHERLPSETQMQGWLSVLPIAFVYAVLSLLAIVTLFRDERTRRSAILIVVGFGLFGTIAIIEDLENMFNVPEHWKPYISSSEEGIELTGMLLLLKASMINTAGFLSPTRSASFPVFEVVRAPRTLLLVLGLVGAPIMAFFTLSLAPSDEHGNPADWPAAAFFLLAAVAAARPVFAGESQSRVADWGLAIVSLIGCAFTIREIDFDPAYVAMAVLSLVAGAFWVLRSRFPASAWVPAIVLIAVSMLVSWVYFDSALLRYVMIQYIAIAFYFVASSPAAESSEVSSQIVAHRSHG